MRPNFRALLLPSALAASMSCGPGSMTMDAGPGGPLSGDGPYLTRAQGQVRMIVVTSNGASAQAAVPESCAVDTYLFATAAPRDLVVQASEGECRLYSGSSDLALPMQNWICAGALQVRYGSSSNTVTVCRAATGRAEVSQPLPCAMLEPGTNVSVTSGPMEIDGDIVPDLQTMAAMPGRVVFTAPTALGVLTWPDIGNLDIQWTSANATSAVVTLSVQNAMGPSPTIVCQPRTNGRVEVPSALIEQANLRTANVIVRVASYRDTTAMAEMGMTYRFSAGFSGSMLMQARR